MTAQDNDHISVRPQIVVEDYTKDDIKRRILNIDKRIHEEPKAFQREIRKIGASSLESIDLSKRDERVVHAAKKASALIKEFIENRYDWDASYDKATEDTLKQDTAYAHLIEESHKTESHSSMAGSSSDERTNTEVEQARDSVRLYRLGAYIDRVVKYQSQAEPASDDLSSAI